MAVAGVCRDSAALVVVVDELKPRRGNRFHRVAENPVGVAPLEDSEVRIDCRYKSLDLAGARATVEVHDGKTCPPDNAPGWVHAPHLDCISEQIHALRVVLAVELARMQTAAVRLKPPLDFGKRIGEKRLLVLHDEIHIIDETDVVRRDVIQHPMIEVVEVVVHPVLPKQMPDCRADSVGL